MATLFSQQTPHQCVSTGAWSEYCYFPPTESNSKTSAPQATYSTNPESESSEHQESSDIYDAFDSDDASTTQTNPAFNPLDDDSKNSLKDFNFTDFYTLASAYLIQSVPTIIFAAIIMLFTFANLNRVLDASLVLLLFAPYPNLFESSRLVLLLPLLTHAFVPVSMKAEWMLVYSTMSILSWFDWNFAWVRVSSWPLTPKQIEAELHEDRRRVKSEAMDLYWTEWTEGLEGLNMPGV